MNASEPSPGPWSPRSRRFPAVWVPALLAAALASPAARARPENEEAPRRGSPGIDMERVPPPLRRLGRQAVERLAAWIEGSGHPRQAERLLGKILDPLHELQLMQAGTHPFSSRPRQITRRRERLQANLQDTLNRAPPELLAPLLEVLGPSLADAGVRLAAPWDPGAVGEADRAPPARRGPRPMPMPPGAGRPPAWAPPDPLPQSSEGSRGPARQSQGAGGPIALLAVLLAAFASAIALRRRIAAWIVRMGTPAPLRLPPAAQAGAAGPAAPVAGGGTAAALPHGPLPTGYRILRRIGEGGMGTVYEAVDVSLERRVAVKRMRDEIRSDPRERERFLKEARTVAKLRHPNIIEIHAIVENEGEIYLVFEFLEGRTLDAALSAEDAMDLDAARRVVRQTCAALDYAHGLGVVHRDLKPSNIMLLPDGLVKVMDFGVARQAKDARDRLSMTNTVTGTPPYMAPEAETGVVRRESDLYAVGVFLYEMLTGERPFAGTGAGLLLNKMQMTYVPASRKVPRLPAAVDAVIAQALQADPERRPRTAGELAAAFEAALA